MIKEEKFGTVSDDLIFDQLFNRTPALANKRTKIEVLDPPIKTEKNNSLEIKN